MKRTRKVALSISVPTATLDYLDTVAASAHVTVSEIVVAMVREAAKRDYKNMDTLADCNEFPDDIDLFGGFKTIAGRASLVEVPFALINRFDSYEFPDDLDLRSEETSLLEENED